MDRALTQPRPVGRSGRRRLVLAVAGVGLLLVAGPLGRAVPAAAAPSAARTVVSGSARFEVVTPTLIRLEYASDRGFEDSPTVSTVPRDGPVPAYQAGSDGGWLTIRTAALTLRYAEGSGPFTPANLGVDLSVAGAPTTAHPTWRRPAGSCGYGTRCEAEDGRLTGGQSVQAEHRGFSGRGYAVDAGQRGSTDAWTITGVPAGGRYALTVGYANGSRASRTLALDAGGQAVGRLRLPPTGGWSTWRTVSTVVRLAAGDNVLRTRCTASVSCRANLDSVAVTARPGPMPADVGTSPPAVDEPGQLGGWTRGLDLYPNQAGPDPAANGLHPGVLNRRGWTLLDDSASALRTPDGWVRPRPERARTYQDGYFFGYGHDYATALADLRVLTGPAVLLPQWALGVWYSAYEPIPARRYADELLPAFAAHRVPVDALVVDTDWKAPERWDGWSWNPELFPDPGAFLAWARQQRLAVALNVHASIDGTDPKFAETQAAAGGRLVRAGQCFSPDCYRFDLGDRRQAQAWFALHAPFEGRGVRQWWLDWCCTSTVVDVPGVTPDSWLNEQYARRLDTATTRGFVLSRLGSSFEDYRGAYPSGAWGEHRSTVHFTGDTAPTWATLAYAARLGPAEASIGVPYVSHDIGSFLGRHLPDDLYLRWVQLGTFSPVLRLHSHHGDRLPWQYAAAQQPAADFLRLHEALVPYTASLGWDASTTGQPITRPLYLDDPEAPEAYTATDEYRFGRDLLVAPVTTPGEVATRTVWFPPGRWVGWFDGRTYTGPSTATVTAPLGTMPVFLRGGGIVPQAPGLSRVEPSPTSLQLTVASGPEPGSFTLHQDAGEGAGYTQGELADTRLDYSARPGRWWRRAASRVDVGAAVGHYPGAATARTYTVDLLAVDRPRAVTVDGADLAETDPRATGPGWWYDPAAATLHVRTAALGTATPHRIEQRGGRVLDRP